MIAAYCAARTEEMQTDSAQRQLLVFLGWSCYSARFANSCPIHNQNAGHSISYHALETVPAVSHADGALWVL